MLSAALCCGLDLSGKSVDGIDGVVCAVAHLVFGADNEACVFTQTGTGGDEVAADHVFFHAFECVGFAADGCFVEDFGCFLE